MAVQNENSAVPQEHAAAVERALSKTFGVSKSDEISDLTERPGSNRAFRIVVEGRSYLLRINTRRGDVARQFTNMRMAAEAGLAPRVWYTSEEDRISITDFVHAVPFPGCEAQRHIPIALRVLHSLPRFTEAPFNTTCTFLLNKGPMLDGFIQKFQSESPLPTREIEEVFRQYARIIACYAPPASDIVPSHNDLFKPDNILFDGRRPWLVDWEASFPNDRYADIAVVANMLASNEGEEETLLRKYFAAPSDEYQRARLHLMRQVAHMFYAMAFLAGSSEEKLAAMNEPAPSYSEFQQQFWSGELALADDKSKATFSRVHWNELVYHLHQPRFEESLQTVRRSDT